MTDERAAYWDAVGREWQGTRPQSLWRAHSDAVNTALFGRWLPAVRVERLLKTDLFDEACGDGLRPLLVARAEEIFGIDLSASTARSARSRCLELRAIGADVRRLPFADKAFDVVVSNSTLDHFECAEEIITSLRELHRVLRVGGQLLLTLDNPANPAIAVRNVLPFRLVNRLGIVPYFVGSTCGPRSLRRNLEQVGFQVLEVVSVMHSPRVLMVFLARILGSCAPLATQIRFLRLLMAMERLAELPTRFLTGHFVAARSMKL